MIEAGAVGAANLTIQFAGFVQDDIKHATGALEFTAFFRNAALGRLEESIEDIAGLAGGRQADAVGVVGQ